MKQPIVNCPNCGKIIVWDTSNRYRPFCPSAADDRPGAMGFGSYQIPDPETDMDTDADAEKQKEMYLKMSNNDRTVVRRIGSLSQYE